MSITTRIWIAGAGGRLGSALCRRFDRNIAYKLVTSDRDLPVEDSREIGRFADLNHPDVIINCAGLTDVHLCEEKPEEAYKVNAIGARNLAVAARRIDAKLIQISTDDVFDGTGDAPLCEFDDAHPVTMYGRSKYAGERLVGELTDKHVIVRSSWLYGAGADDFITRVMDAAARDSVVRLAEDEISTPTSAEALAGFIDCLIHSREFGLYHASCEGGCSRSEYAREILRLAGMEDVPVVVEEGTGARVLRPRYTLLDNMMLRITGLYRMPDWKAALRDHFGHRTGGGKH
ncbi:dTDP-4-dehydrorhamnose reductase [Pseudoflavonifractor sp. MSJ-37]|uniref:dTDP-4-dehydrorhamnose reductase n=1 Tax=Pseudoflavonifractor sp. MSJ-37 TaxID=2841531 RepID=UPI001C10CF0B|nr:dTDP-4-dehydrorhamnose reductase [Pseudoflavonifractor sp. MSJ-37]MBU5435697.1 dTDP-4-dehydrorhamnose reductase [Pseudoflavonifractor sp. MSJ-37]